MATEPLSAEAIVLTEKKMDMSLDEIIKMSKKPTNKGKKQQRPSNKSQTFNGVKANALRVRQYMDSRSAVRQGALAKRRSNFQGNQFPSTTEAARKAAFALMRDRALNSKRIVNANKSRARAWLIQKRAANGDHSAKAQQSHHENQEKSGNGGGANMQRPRTLDSLFANMKEQRMTAFSSQRSSGRGNGGGGGRGRLGAPWVRGRFGN